MSLRPECRFQIRSRQGEEGRAGRETQGVLAAAGRVGRRASQSATERQEERGGGGQEPRASVKAEKEGIHEEGAGNHQKLGHMSTEQRPSSCVLTAH